MSFLKIILFFFCSLSLFAIDIKIKPDNPPIRVTQEDISSLKYYLQKKYRFHIDDKGAKKIVLENRILADEYLKKGLTNKEKNRLKIEIETRLADSFVNYLQKQIKIPQKVLKSYYYDHIKDFKMSDKVKIDRIRFQSYQDALAFYTQYNKTSHEADQLLNKHRGKVIYKGIVEKDRLKANISSYLEKGKENYVLPPIVLRSNAIDVYYVEKYFPSQGYKPFKEVKKEIEDRLYKMTFVKKRDEILNKYRIEDR